MIAMQGHHLSREVVEALLVAGAWPGELSSGESPLNIAHTRGRRDIAKLLIFYGAPSTPEIENGLGKHGSQNELL
jgi:hypothetical protein